MRNMAQWVTAQPARGFVAAAALGIPALFMLPLAAWLPASVMVLALLAGGPRAAAFAAAGTALPIAWGIGPFAGVAGSLAVGAAVLLPAYLAATLLERTRSLSFVFQWVTIGAVGVLVALHLVLGDPVGVLMPFVEQVRPALEETARTLSRMGIESSPEEIGVATARVAWATSVWLVLLHTMLAQFGGLWAFGLLREPGLFGRQFRALKLGRFVGWLTVAALVASVGLQMLLGKPWQPMQDVLFVLAGAFVLQALAVVHALREAQAVGVWVLVVTYLSLGLAPMAVVGLGFADTWFGFRERLGRKPGPSQG